MDPPAYRHDHLRLGDHTGDVLGAYHRRMGLRRRYAPGLVFNHLWTLFCGWSVTVRDRGGGNGSGARTRQDEEYEVFHPSRAPGCSRQADVDRLDDLGLFLLQRLHGAMVWW